MSENFKAIKGFEGRYWISDLGKVFDCEKKRFLSQYLRGSASKYYSVSLNGKGHYVHRLIAEAFIENPFRKEQVDHMDGNRHNNNLSNLRWVSNSENMQNKKTTKGYCWHKASKKWQAHIRIDNKLIHLGLYYTEEEARQAYLKAKKIYHPSSPIV